ncbi:MAG: hypothetical protein O3B73_10130 [bacterium]|nr:hypothetical protein [bacterium]
MEFVSTKEAGERKACSPQSIWNAIKRGELNAQQIGRSFVVAVDQKFESWEPNRQRQQIGKESQKTST